MNTRITAEKLQKLDLTDEELDAIDVGFLSPEIQGEVVTHKALDELSHYGVLGMKWGVRKDRVKKPAFTTKEALGKRISKKKPKTHKTNIKDLSTNELRDKNERLRLENEYTRLTQTKVQKFVNKSTGKLVDKVFDRATNKALEKMFGSSDKSTGKSDSKLKKK